VKCESIRMKRQKEGCLGKKKILEDEILHHALSPITRIPYFSSQNPQTMMRSRPLSHRSLSSHPTLLALVSTKMIHVTYSHE
jgi:hypothetical protein